MDLQRALQAGCDELGLALSPAQHQAIIGLVQQLMKWNNAYNLTAIRDPMEALRLHVLDSLTLVPHVAAGTLLDVGTGPGFPSLPLAIARPDLHIVALDSNNKKIRFIRQMAHELGLKNIDPVQARVETYTGEFTQITSRAFAELKDFITVTEHLLAKNGYWLAMKSQLAPTELAALEDRFQTDTIDLHVPGLNADRCLIKIQLRES